MLYYICVYGGFCEINGSLVIIQLFPILRGIYRAEIPRTASFCIRFFIVQIDLFSTFDRMSD